jgi:hypothetical protein
MSILDDIVDRTREEVKRRRKAVPEDQLRARLVSREDGRPFAEALASQPGVSVIAEHKRRAPSAPEPLREGADVAEIVSAYERAGATALSVLTDGPYFGGALEDLAAARAASRLPIIRKDFIVHPYQVVEIPDSETTTLPAGTWLSRSKVVSRSTVRSRRLRLLIPMTSASTTSSARSSSSSSWTSTRTSRSRSWASR